LTEPITSVAPPRLVTVTVFSADIAPTVSLPNASDVALRARIGTLGGIPVPRRPIVCGDPLALSAMLIVAALSPVEGGLKVTEIVQLAPVASEAPQVFVNEKSAGVSPLNAMELIDSGAVPVFVTVIDCGADVALTASLPNASDLALNVTGGGAATPVPLTATDCGEPLALSEILILADLPPAETGLKVAEIVQLVPAASEDPQVFVSEKSSLVLPPNVMELMDTGAALVLVTEIDFGADVPLTTSLPKARDVALSVIADETGVRRRAAYSPVAES